MAVNKKAIAAQRILKTESLLSHVVIRGFIIVLAERSEFSDQLNCPSQSLIIFDSSFPGVFMFFKK
ncbi:hypothetical protein S675_002930 [Salmonella enterica subsp. enterica]|nr:hypothetical protein [Salmonella enterica]EDQ6554751.1 hypothetical protein [Salmonella enterica subsp. enterica]EKL0024084.1 hypothetical protein [Salmonella enterica]